MVAIDVPSSSGIGPPPSARGGMFSSNRGRVIILALLAMVPIVTYRSDILSMFAADAPPPADRSQVTAEQFNSYKLNAPLFEAVQSNDVELVKRLLEGGVDGDGSGEPNGARTSFYNVNAEDSRGITPLIEATLMGNAEMVTFLLARGARAQPAPGFRHTPLRAACLTANADLIALLIEKGADPNAASEGGRTPLMGACYLRPSYDEAPDRVELSYRAVRLMLADERTDPRAKNNFGESALDLCRGRGYNKSMALIRERIMSAGKTGSPRDQAGKGKNAPERWR